MGGNNSPFAVVIITVSIKPCHIINLQRQYSKKADIQERSQKDSEEVDEVGDLSWARFGK